MTNLVQIPFASPSGRGRANGPEDLMQIGGPASLGSSAGFERGIGHMFEAGRVSHGESSERGSAGILASRTSDSLGGLGGSSAEGSTPRLPTAASSLRSAMSRLESLVEEPTPVAATVGVSDPTQARAIRPSDLNPFVLGTESDETGPLPPPQPQPQPQTQLSGPSQLEGKSGLVSQGGQSSLLGLESLVHWTATAAGEPAGLGARGQEPAGLGEQA